MISISGIGRIQRMAISLVMATYNGEKFLKEQLESIRIQSLEPDEVLIFDDQSTDKTVTIIQDFIATHGLAHWKLYVNHENKGYAKNFIEGISQAKNEIIFFSDQDDIWNEDKIEKMSIAFIDKKILAVDSDYKPLVSSDMDKLSKIFFWLEDKTTRQTGKFHISKFESFGLLSGRPGWTMAVRKDFFDANKGYFVQGFSHDRFVAGIAAMNNGLYHYSSKTGQFRRWPNSTTAFAGPKTSLIEKEVKVSEQYAKRADVFINYLKQNNKLESKAKKHALLISQKKYFENRILFLKSRNFSDYFRTLINAKKIDSVWKLKDLLIVLKIMK